MTPLFAQVQASFALSRTITQNLTGAMLAQEGVELVRAVRDDNWFQGNPYDQDLRGCTGGCLIQYDDDAPQSVGGRALLLDDAGRYQYTSGNETDFFRTITIDIVSDGTTEFLRVTSEVSWAVRGKIRQVVVEDFLFDWLSP